MNPQQQLQLEDAQKKLSVFRKHLDLLARCSGESKNVQKDEVLSAVAELQSLVEWAALQPDLGAESAVLLVKLQELHHIRENLEKSSSEGEKYADPKANDTTNPGKSGDNSKDLGYISDMVSATLWENNAENNVDEDSASVDKDSLCDYSFSTEDRNVANAGSPESIEDANVEVIPNDEKTDDEANQNDKDILHSVKEFENTINNEDMSHEIFVTSPECGEMKTNVIKPQSNIPGVISPDLYRSEVVIIETDDDNKSTEWVSDFKNSNDPLDICMYAIRNLYESLRVKENELMKLSTMQNDQKHIEALQAVIIDFHKDITNLNSELENSKKENLLLKEQVLELEEAENDARLEAQKLEQKLVFLQEKDSHSQAELTQLKLSLKKSVEALVEKEVLEKELRSQIKYMETLVQKYEDQIKANEAKAASDASENIENSQGNLMRDDKENQKERITCNKGTQTYPPSQTKIDISVDVANNIETDDSKTRTDLPVLRSSGEYKNVTCKEEYKDSTTDPNSSTSKNETTQSTEQADFVNIELIENISQKGLLKRLHKLIDEDVSLQQQIHYIDEINLALWKKLQNLDNHIGECKRQNINETNLVIAETDQANPRGENSIHEAQESSKSNPQEMIINFDQNEQYIQEQMIKLGEINASFEKELRNRENLCKEKDKRYEEWIETEKRVLEDVGCLSKERDWIANQVSNLKVDIEAREKLIIQLKNELTAIRNKNQEEITKLQAEQERITEPFNLKVNEMLTKEKEILRMITNLKSKENKNKGKNELERLKCNYIELQLELSNARDKIRKMEENFKILLDEYANKHLLEETRVTSELERLHNQNTRCCNMIDSLQSNHKHITNLLQKQQKYLQGLREKYKKSLEETELEHRSVETELKSQLREIEEGTAIASTVIKEEKMKVEKELQANIEDLKAKGEVYKARIEELERDVICLQEELHKMNIDPEAIKVMVERLHDGKRQLQDINQDEVTAKIKEISSHEAEDSKFVIGNSSVPATPDNIKLLNEIIVEKRSPTAENENSGNIELENSIIEKRIDHDEVDELRAQVRELQSHIEKISEEVAELPPVQAAKPITASSLKMQKVEDLDYAEVDECCFDAWKERNESTSEPKFQDLSTRSKEKSNNQEISKESAMDNDYDEVLPRPTNFHVVQKVGADTLLVGWNYVNPSVLDGFEIYVDGQVHERIYIPDRTKALISGLNLRKPIRLSICALSRYGQISEPTALDLSTSQHPNSNYFDDEEDEYKDFEDAMNKQRPYSMEW